MKFLDLFAGIGGFRLGLEAAGHECVGFCEIDKFARASYKAIHGLTDDNENKEWEAHDVRSVSDESIRELGRSVGNIDIICGGFPCQAYSIAGKRRGFSDTRGTLFFEIARFASLLRPKYLFLENVKGLLNHEGGATFETILSTLDELGYGVEWHCLNSKAVVPQNRERVFIIGHLRGASTRKVFPFQFNSRKANESGILASTITTRYGASQREGSDIATAGEVRPILTPEKLTKRQNGRRFKEGGEPMFTLTAQDRHGIILAGKLPGNHDQNARIYDPNGIAPTLSTMQGGQQEPKIIQRPRGYNKGNTHEIAPTLSSNSWQENNLLKVGGIYTNDSDSHHRGLLDGLSRTLKAQKQDAGVFDGVRIRKLTPKECWRLQGFPDWAFEKARAVNSDSQLYKQAGNSVTVPVIVEIAKRLK